MSQLNDIISRITSLTGYNLPTASGIVISQSASPLSSGSVNNIIEEINTLTGFSIPGTTVQYVSGSNVAAGPIIVYTPFAAGGTISTAGITPGAIIKSEHVLRIINALNGVNINDIIVSGSFTASGSNTLDGTFSLPFISNNKVLITSGGFVVGTDTVPTASYAITASFAINGGGTNVNTSSFVTTSSFNAFTESINTATSSFVTNSQTSSFVLNSQTSSMTVATASYVTASAVNGTVASASYALTASYAMNGGGGGNVNTSSLLTTASVLLNTITFTKGDGSTFPITVNTGSGGGGGTPGGSNTEIQYNSGSVFDGNTSFTFNYISKSLQQGDTVTGSGLYSHAEGESTIARGYASHAEGYFTIASGSWSHAEGESTIAIGGSSHAEGNATRATGEHSHAEGDGTIASGSLSHAEGTSTISYGQFSHAEGNSTVANGIASHAEGSGAISSGSYSHAEGSETIAIGEGSHAEGYFTIAQGDYQHVQGQYNATSSVQSAFIIGNGTDDNNRNNLIYAAGTQVEISGSLITRGNQTITGSVISTLGFTGSLQGTASFATSASRAISSSFAISSSNALSSSFATSASYSVTASYALFALSSSNATNAATASNILGGKATHIPFFKTDTTLATSSIYQSGSSTVIINQDNATTANPEALYVYQPSTTSFNVISGKGNLNNYLQLNIQNTNQGTSASSDVVATADNGNETTNYIDMGINSENYSQNFVGAANDAYLYSTGRHLHIGNTSNFPVQIFAGGSDVDVYNKLELNPNNQHQMTGSLDVSGSVKAFSFTGSLQGNATSATTSNTSSYSTTLGASLSQPANNQVRLLNSAGGTLSTATINNVTSASYADNAATANFATTAGNGGVTNIVAGSGITLIPTSGVGAVTVISSGGGGVTIISGSNVTQSFSNTSTWTFNHNLGTRVPIITVFDTNYKQIIPQDIELVSTSSATITFPTAESGFAVASLGGATGTVLSSSYALFSTYADTASYYAETDPVYIAQKPTLATTGSNIFRGNQTITGSLIVSGSSTFTNIGPAVFTGSVSITGSTTQTGNNTLTGNTVLSGSIGISGSSTIQGTTIMSGSLNISGSTTQRGNNTLIGTTTLTGSINMSGDIIPTASSSFDLGSETNPWRSIYVQSGSISIQSDIPGGPSAIISNANGNVTIAGAGFQIKTGSFVPFEISSTARTIIRVPNLPANDVGGLSIIGSSDGSYQGVTNAGGLLHLTSNDGVSSRITSDAYGTAANAAYVGRKARGTAASPLPVQSGDVLTRISSIGWTGTDYGFTMSASLTTAPTSIDVVALENYTTSSFGSRFNFYSVPTGSTVRTLSAQIDTTGITIPSTSKFFGTASWANNAQTASYVNPLRQDVIITGSLKVSGSLTEIGDTVLSGSLTLSSGSALRINNGFYVDGQKQFNYGQFSSTETQSGSADTAYSATFNTTDFSQGVSLVSQSRITVANTGIYNIQFSSQLHTTANQAVDFSIWFAMTGSDIANSNTDFTVEKIAGGGYAVAALNFLTRIASGSYVELKYSKTTAQGQLQAKGTQATPTRPATPSVILTLTQIA